MNFTHLHTHSHYSLLEAVPQVGDLVEKAKSLGYKSLALTDSNNLYGAIEFQKECKSKGIKSIIGCEISVCEKSMYEEINATTNRVFKLVLLCRNEAGYWNLVKLVSRAHIEPKGKNKICVDLNELKNHREGLICLTGLNESYLAEKLRQNDFENAKNFLEELKYIFYPEEDTQHHKFILDNNAENFTEDESIKPVKFNLFIEIGIGDTPEGKLVRDNSIKIAKDLNLPIVAGSNSHYLNLGDRAAQKVVMGISNEIDGKERFNRVFKNSNFAFHTPAEIEKYFGDVKEAIINTDKIAKACNFQITLGKWVFPKVEIPDGKTPDEYLREITYAGFERRKMPQNDITLTRVNYELEVIKMKGYANYFLCVADMLRAAKEKKILTNIRGSVSGSLVTYLSGITNIDPLEFEIPFERFLNPDRPSAPDIDMDYADNRREGMVEYVKENME